MVPRRVLPVIVASQFAGTSLWFAVNAVLPDLQAAWQLPADAVATLSSAVQLGFVAGTLVFSLLMVADRFAPTKVFLACSLLGALANASMLLLDGHFPALLAMRFAVGFLLAGIYPVGMKIAASWYREGLGAALGVLIGALVVGTALPHGLRALAGEGGMAVPSAGALAPWHLVVLGVSLLAALGGVLTALLVPENPDVARGAPVSPRGLGVIWSDMRLRASVFGYFGHMGELYAFIVLVPLIAATRVAGGSVSALAFWSIAAGMVGCVAGGLLARRFGSARIAQVQLAASGACCLAAPLMLAAPLPVFVGWLLLWGCTVAGDSPQFSALTARNAPAPLVGSVLTFTNCIGFAISIVSIEVFVRAAHAWPLEWVLPWMAIGPVLGLWMLAPLLRKLGLMQSGRKVALVTGSATGVGAATALILAQRGYDVLINYSKSEAEAREAEAACKAAGADTLLVRGNVAEDADCRALAQAAADRWGRIDALVNNAGVSVFGEAAAWDALDAQVFQRVLGVNTLGTFQMVRACLPQLKAARGCVVNVSSVAGTLGMGSSVPYVASKGAVNAMTLHLARVLAPEIRVNAVCPGLITSRWFVAGMGQQAYEQIKANYEAKMPLRNSCTPEDVAQAIVWLVTGAQTVTGELVQLDSGMHLG